MADEPIPSALDPEQVVASQSGLEPAATAEELTLKAAGQKELSDVIKRVLENIGLAKDIKARQDYGFWLFVLAAAWIVAVLLVVLLQGFLAHRPDPIFNLSENVLIASIGSTTVNVLGLLAIVIRYLFYRNKEQAAE